MKTISTLLASLILSISVFALDRPSGSLFVQSNDRGNVKVMLDGKLFESRDNTLFIQDVRSGNHDVKVYRQRNSGMYSTYVQNYELVYDGRLNVNRGKQISITIDRFGGVKINEQKNRGDRGYIDQDYNRPYHSDNRSDRYDSDYRDNDFRFSRAISDKELDFVLYSIGKEWFESNKLESARHIIATNYFTSGQVKSLLQLFSFESNRLELAKLAYKMTVDPGIINVFLMN